MTISTQITGLIISLLICFIVAGLGALTSINAGEFYAALAKPDWAPPAWLFGPAWTVLYIIMAIASWLVWRQEGFGAAQIALSLYLTQLVFNALWSWLFFSLHNGMWAFIDISLLWVSLVILIYQFWKISIVASIMLLPYILWVSFATMLNFSIWQLNPELL